MKTQMQPAGRWQPAWEAFAVPGGVRPACAALGEARQATTMAGGLAGALRRLRRDLERCARCTLNTTPPDAPACPLPAYWNLIIHQAIGEINDEWDTAAAAARQAQR